MSSNLLSVKLGRELSLKKYLKELGALLGREVYENELGSADQASVIRQAALKFSSQPVSSRKISFPERTSERFAAYIQRLSKANALPIYVWTPRTGACGALLVPTLSAIKFDFEFSVNDEGILVFLTTDLCDRLLLDFSSADTNVTLLKVETQGEHWLQVDY